ncbi:uncharacterized protein LOC124154378 isoform X2 [Ischnura elegans]|uniref:uncharacterized protein LOC124154378 isoform X2 n=1 Tax=Ischnura elegans TaxID=197161 RepID=UPI001ED8A29C|nr:uncharacterized protein LOC124154378 isoform X2 [Ischnura elegans]
MVSPRQLMILGSFVGLFTLILSNPNAPPFEDTEEFWECRGKSLAQRSKFDECLNEDFSEEEVNATVAMYPDSNCIVCKHLCRKQDVVQRCIRETSDVLRTFSNKSEEMIPFVKNMVEESLLALCDNDGRLINVFLNDDNADCLNSSWRACEHLLEGAGNFNRIAVCDFTEPESDPYSKEFICQKYLDLLECGKVESGKCSEEMKNSLTGVISKWREGAFCGKYLNTLEN